MKYLSFSFFFLLSISFSFGQTFERSVLASAGGHLSNNTYSIDYTFGETISGTLENGEQLTQGFQQVWLITTAVSETGVEDLNSLIYPNPTVGILNIESETPTRVQLFDASGQLLIKSELASGKQEMNLSGFPAGMYTLRMESKEGNASKIFRVIKME